MNKFKQTVAFHTLGCKLNYAETSTIARQMEQAGYQKVAFDTAADLYVINTCSVTENADREFRKIVHRAKRLSPEARIAVIGCYAQLRPEEIAATEGVNLILGAGEKFNLPHHLAFETIPDTPLIVRDADLERLHGCEPAYSLGDRTRTYLKIQDGCDYPCTYCTIPMARGRSRSLAPDQLLSQIKEILADGVQEIVLTGVNVGDYRYDGQTLLDLLQRLDSLDGLRRVRISSIEPNLLTDEIIELVADSDTILPHFHIPLQSGSDRILRLMKRRYGTDIYRQRIAKIRELLPDAGIGVDVIVGFPGEGETEFQETYRFLESLDVSYLHVFTYSERPDTPAVKLPEKVPHALRKARNRELTRLSVTKSQAFMLRQMNQPQSVLIETARNGYLTGMTANYIPVRIPGEQSDLENTIVSVKLTALRDGKAYGRLIK